MKNQPKLVLRISIFGIKFNRLILKPQFVKELYFKSLYDLNIFNPKY